MRPGDNEYDLYHTVQRYNESNSLPRFGRTICGSYESPVNPAIESVLIIEPPPALIMEESQTCFLIAHFLNSRP